MKKISKEVEAIMLERFGKDSIIALATANDNIPYVRSVDAFYEGLNLLSPAAVSAPCAVLFRLLSWAIMPTR